MSEEIAIIPAGPAPPADLGGRPSLYQPDFCQAVVEHCSTGYSLTSFAASVGVSRRTLGVWMAAHDEFAEAVGLAKAKAAAWWEGKARDIAEGKGGPGASTVCLRALNNFAQEDWTETQKHEHVGRIAHVLMTRDQALEEARRRGLPERIFTE